MKHYLLGGGRAATLLIGLWLLATTTWAQAPAWVLALPAGISNASGFKSITAVATDASGNVFVTGGFSGTVLFGSTTLSSAGYADIYLAKYVPSTNTWAWAVRGGGTDLDIANGVAVQGTSVYITGGLINNANNLSACTFGNAATSSGTAPQAGAGGGPVNFDIVLAKYTDNGTSATFGWSQVAGGSLADIGYGVAVRGNNVYVTGQLYNDQANTNAVLFGGTGTTPGTLPQYGASTNSYKPDLVLAKYIDNGPTATVAWTQVAGGTGEDIGNGVAVSETSVYVTGTLENTSTNANAVVVGGAGTTAGTLSQYGASTANLPDILLAKYTDTGPSATVAWTQVGGGTGYDKGAKVAVSGSSVYVTGALFNDQANTWAVLFGGAGTTLGTVPQAGASTATSHDIVLAKYVDNGSTATFGWSQVAGGTDQDAGHNLAASGSSIYLTGHATNNAANATAMLFGGTGTTVGTSAVPGFGSSIVENILVAKYVDNGPSAGLAWAKTAGSTIGAYGTALALTGTRLYVVGQAYTPALFGSLSISPQYGGEVSVLAALDLPAALATSSAAASPTARLYPNPAPGAATLSGATAGTAVHIFDALGRRVATATADATGAAQLPAGLAPGLYLVRAGASTVRWAVE